MSKNKQYLAEALKEICMSKPLDMVTVTEITKKAGLTRQIFYHHFMDKYELAKWIHFQDYLFTLKSQYDDCSDVISWKKISYDWLKIIEKEKEFYRNIYTSSSQNTFLYLIHQHFLESYKQILYHVHSGNPTQEQIFAVEFFCIGLTLKIHEWIKSPFPDSAETFCNLLFSSMPKEVEAITSQYQISKNELISITEFLTQNLSI